MQLEQNLIHFNLLEACEIIIGRQVSDSIVSTHFFKRISTLATNCPRHLRVHAMEMNEIESKTNFPPRLWKMTLDTQKKLSI